MRPMSRRCPRRRSRCITGSGSRRCLCGKFDAIAGGCPAASYFLLLRQNKVAKEKATPVCRPCGVPCVARLVRRLRNSHCALKQSSPKSSDQPALLGGSQGIKKQKPKTEK